MSLPAQASTSTVGGVTSTADAPGAQPAQLEGELAESEPASIPRVRRSRASRWLAPTSVAPIYLGVVLIAAGFGALTYTWSRVAGTAIVALQLPYIASGGFTGVGLVILGILSIHLGARRRDAWQRDRRLEELASAIAAMSKRRQPAAHPSDERSA